MKHTLAVLVENKPGVLSHISGLISRRAFNIESIAAGYTEEPDTTRITIVVDGDEQEQEQVINQLSKLVNVIMITDLTTTESIQRELTLIKVKADAGTRSDIINIVEIFRAGIVDVSKDTMVIELSGDDTKIEALCKVLEEEYGIIEMVRTGKIALSRGAVPAKSQ